MKNKKYCEHWDCGWCYHKLANSPHPCPGIKKCDIEEVKTETKKYINFMGEKHELKSK